MKIWEKFKTLANARQSLNQRECWKKCDDCKKPWNDTGTQYVHMKVKQQNHLSKTVYICDSCLDDMKEANKMPPYTCGFIDEVQHRLATLMIDNNIDEKSPLYDELMEQLHFWDVIRMNITAVRKWGINQSKK